MQNQSSDYLKSLTSDPLIQNDRSQKDLKLVFNTSFRLMQVKNIAEC